MPWRASQAFWSNPLAAFGRGTCSCPSASSTAPCAGCFPFASSSQTGSLGLMRPKLSIWPGALSPRGALLDRAGDHHPGPSALTGVCDQAAALERGQPERRERQPKNEAKGACRCQPKPGPSTRKRRQREQKRGRKRPRQVDPPPVRQPEPEAERADEQVLKRQSPGDHIQGARERRAGAVRPFWPALFRERRPVRQRTGRTRSGCGSR